MSKRILVFAPHPDDETWGCGGTIAKKISEGYEVIIIFMTDGRHAFTKMLGIYSSPSPAEMKVIREEEAIRAAKILGVPQKNLIFLEFEDGTLGLNEAKVQKKVMEILENYPPTEVYFPYEKDFHPDHCATNKIVTDSISKMGISVLKFKYSIVQRFGRVGPMIDVFLNVFKHNMIEVDVSEFSEIKKRALYEFKSEISIITPEQKRPVLTNIHKIVRPKEVFYLDD